MVADTYSARVGLIEQATGNNNNNWGTIFNSSFTDLLDRVIAGIDTHAVTGGTLDLSVGTLPPSGPSPVAATIQTFTGTLTSAQTVIWPALTGCWRFSNSTSGAFPLLIKTSAQATPICIPANKLFCDVFCNGTSVFRMNRHEIGRVSYHAGTTVPDGMLECDGSSLLQASYPDLFAVIGTTYGSVDGTHFTLPNLKDTGRFIRSRSASITIGTSQSNQNAAHTHSVTGTPAVGTLTTDSQGAHSHTANVTDPTHNHTYGSAGSSSTGGGGFGIPGSASGNTGSSATGISVSIVSAGAHTHTVTGTLTAGSLATASSGGTESRPESLVMMACIQY